MKENKETKKQRNKEGNKKNNKAENVMFDFLNCKKNKLNCMGIFYIGIFQFFHQLDFSITRAAPMPYVQDTI